MEEPVLSPTVPFPILATLYPILEGIELILSGWNLSTLSIFNQEVLDIYWRLGMVGGGKDFRDVADRILALYLQATADNFINPLAIPSIRDELTRKQDRMGQVVAQIQQLVMNVSEYLTAVRYALKTLARATLAQGIASALDRLESYQTWDISKSTDDIALLSAEASKLFNAGTANELIGIGDACYKIAESLGRISTKILEVRPEDEESEELTVETLDESGSNQNAVEDGKGKGKGKEKAP